MKEVVILSAVRTPIGAYLGSLSDIPAPRLGAVAVRAAVERSGVDPKGLDECLMGNVLSGGLGQAPARQAALFAALPAAVRCTTLNRVCGSGLKTVMWGAQMLQTGDVDAVVAGGMESMSGAPYLLPKARKGYRMGHDKVIDLMVHDGLWDVYNNFHMGNAAELCAKEKDISRADQDCFAKQSYERALLAAESGWFMDEMVPVEVPGKKGQVSAFAADEEPVRARLDKFGELRPVFSSSGTITAANASSLSDGAAAMVLTTSEQAKKWGAKPIARVVAQASHAQQPEWFTTAPVGAIEKLLQRAHLRPGDVDLYEINEAFAVVALACIRDLRLDESKVNIHGGAIALGHPLGASGTRILTTLIHSLKRTGKRLGVAALCIGGGEASAVLVESLG
ncbi:MAG: thiolase family protein [Bdellovibrionales bacterium]|nr:thiolase family protein [Bdellovibrionales bacterium]